MYVCMYDIVGVLGLPCDSGIVKYNLIASFSSMVLLPTILGSKQIGFIITK